MTIDMSRIQIVALCGSLTAKSATRSALQVALESARQSGASAELIDLRQWHLPFAGSDFAPDEFPDVARLVESVKSAHGLIWGTPEYHGSYSGVLKNALDLLAIDDFKGKMIGLVGTAAGSMGAINSLSHLRSIGRQLHAWVLPQQVSIAASYRAFDEDGRPRNADDEKRLIELGLEVARFAALHASADDAFVKLWENAGDNPSAVL